MAENEIDTFETYGTDGEGSLKISAYDLIEGLVIQVERDRPAHIVIQVKRDHKREEVKVLTSTSQICHFHFADMVEVTGTFIQGSEGEAKARFPYMFSRGW